MIPPRAQLLSSPVVIKNNPRTAFNRSCSNKQQDEGPGGHVATESVLFIGTLLITLALQTQTTDTNPCRFSHTQDKSGDVSRPKLILRVGQAWTVLSTFVVVYYCRT